VPEVDPETCIACGDCAEVCRYNSIAVLGDRTMVFPELCHGCGSCSLVCPTRSIAEIPRNIGTLEAGEVGAMDFAQGTVNIGEPLAVPVISQLKSWVAGGGHDVMILDSPPGTSCPMVETVSGADFVILVTEPTPAGVHDLELADQVLWDLGLPGGVIVNRDGIGYPELEESCALSRLPVLLRLPFDRGVAEGLARGDTLLDVRPEYGGSFRRVMEDIDRAVHTRQWGRDHENGATAHVGVRHNLEAFRRGSGS
jgi:MinD superfamily P-loop ATPase